MLSPKSGVVLILLTLMEQVALFAVIIGLGVLDATTPGYGLFWLLLLNGMVGLAMAVFVLATRPPAPWNRVMLLAGGACTIIITARFSSDNAVAALMSAILLSLAYWRGLAVAREPAHHQEVLRRFAAGLAVLFGGIILVVARGIFDRPFVWHLLAILGITYTITSMVALGVARIERVREPGAGQAVVLAVGLQLGVLLLFGVGTLLLFSHDIAAALFSATRPLWDAIGAIWYRVFSFLVSPVMAVLEMIRHRESARVHPSLTAAPIGHAGNPKRFHSAQHDDRVLIVIALGILSLIFVAIGTLIWHALPRLSYQSRSSGYTESRRSLLSLSDVWHAILLWLGRFFRRSAGAANQAVAMSRRRIFGPSYPADPVRRAYAQMLHAAGQAGVTRLHSTTPQEFQHQLSSNWPAGRVDISTLTEAYVYRRYGESPLSATAHQNVERSWHRLRPIMKLPSVRAPMRTAPPSAATAAVDLTSRIGRYRRFLVRVWSSKPVALLTRSQMSVELIGAFVAIVALIVFVLAIALAGVTLFK